MLDPKTMAAGLIVPGQSTTTNQGQTLNVASASPKAMANFVGNPMANSGANLMNYQNRMNEMMPQSSPAMGPMGSMGGGMSPMNGMAAMTDLPIKPFRLMSGQAMGGEPMAQPGPFYLAGGMGGMQSLGTQPAGSAPPLMAPMVQPSNAAAVISQNRMAGNMQQPRMMAEGGMASLNEVPPDMEQAPGGLASLGGEGPPGSPGSPGDQGGGLASLENLSEAFGGGEGGEGEEADPEMVARVEQIFMENQDNPEVLAQRLLELFQTVIKERVPPEEMELLQTEWGQEMLAKEVQEIMAKMGAQTEGGMSAADGASAQDPQGASLPDGGSTNPAPSEGGGALGGLQQFAMQQGG